MGHDLLIRNADLADGTGDALRRADVAIENGRVAAVARAGELETANAAEVIESEGLLVTPGFIDPHTHYDGQATWDDRLAPSADHGVSTVVMGNCGVGFAPVRPTHKDVLYKVVGLSNAPGAGSGARDGRRWQLPARSLAPSPSTLAA